MNILKEEQQKHLEAVRWLLNDAAHRQSGRSYLMAMMFVEMLIRYPLHVPIKIYDHYHDRNAHYNMAMKVLELLPRYAKSSTFKYDRNKNTITKTEI